jgi:hypothetical protein
MCMTMIKKTYVYLKAADNITTNNSTNSSNEDDDNFIVFSSQPETVKTIKKANLKVISFFNDTHKYLKNLINYPTIKKLFIRFNTNLYFSLSVERMFSWQDLFIILPGIIRYRI